MLIKRHCLLILIACLFSIGLYAQEDSASLAQRQNYKHKRLPIVAATGGVLYGSALPGLWNLWYKGYPHSSFHFFNDESEWLQMDKCGHTFTSYYEGVYGIKMMKWAGLSDRQAAWYGGTWGLLLQTNLEVMDGYSKQWGFSWGDMLSNTLGTSLAISQQLAWQEQKVQLKFSYTPSPYDRLNPGLLGVGYFPSLIKDYNGQTYWLSVGLKDIFRNEHIPDWLNIAAGYGADGMLRGTATDQYNDPKYTGYTRTRQFYLSLDINTLKLKTKSKIANNILAVIAFIKIPSPAIEYNSNQRFKLHLIYF